VDVSRIATLLTSAELAAVRGKTELKSSCVQKDNGELEVKVNRDM
jgi:hypothetical protein